MRTLPFGVTASYIYVCVKGGGGVGKGKRLKSGTEQSVRETIL